MKQRYSRNAFNFRKDVKELFERINNCHSSDEYTFFSRINSIILNDAWECFQIVKDYPAGAVISVEWFIKCIQPKLKELGVPTYKE